jgi:hypothetical protein
MAAIYAKKVCKSTLAIKIQTDGRPKATISPFLNPLVLKIRFFLGMGNGSEAKLECGKLGPAFVSAAICGEQSGGKPPHSKKQETPFRIDGVEYDKGSNP